MRRKFAATGLLPFIFCLSAARGEERSSALEFREILKGRIAKTGAPIPREAARVFVYEGEPVSLRVTENYIAVSYGEERYQGGNSGVLFDRTTGRMVRRFTVADGWPKTRPEFFAPARRHWPRRKLVGPGVVGFRENPSARRRNEKELHLEVAATAEFDGMTWRAMQPAVYDVIQSADPGKKRERFGAWTPILRRTNEESYVEATKRDGAKKRFTMKDGLANNIVSHLAVAQGTLWAACVDIYDPEKKEWGPGGLCRFDPERSRWERVDEIDGCPVRWVTLLQAVGDELWVGFREGEGVAGDRVIYGMGIRRGDYRPVSKSIVLARLKDGEWTAYSRRPLPEPRPKHLPQGRKYEPPPPTEKPVKLVRSGERIILLSRTKRGGYGHASLLDLKDKRWRSFDIREEIGADVLRDMVSEKGEIILISNRGAHRWQARTRSWRFLDPECALRNPNLSAAKPVGDELWVGCAEGGQGISRFNERTGIWSHMTPEEIGTSCPVRNIVVMPDGEAWVLFSRRPLVVAATSPGFYPGVERDAPEGIGRFRDGGWQFPVKLEGVPDFIEHERKRSSGIERWKQPIPVEHLVAIGDRLFVANAAGVYVGPGKWKEIATGERIRSIRPSEDRKALIIWRERRGWRRTAIELGRYDIKTGKHVRFKKVKPGSAEWQSAYRAEGLLVPRPGERSIHEWLRVPTARRGGWVVGPLGKFYHRVVETPHAVWIASRGELVRLDRKRLADWLGK